MSRHLEQRCAFIATATAKAASIALACSCTSAESREDSSVDSGRRSYLYTAMAGQDAVRNASLLFAWLGEKPAHRVKARNVSYKKSGYIIA